MVAQFSGYATVIFRRTREKAEAFLRRVKRGHAARRREKRRRDIRRIPNGLAGLDVQ